jgi:hypothetical protein
MYFEITYGSFMSCFALLNDDEIPKNPGKVALV